MYWYYVTYAGKGLQVRYAGCAGREYAARTITRRQVCVKVALQVGALVLSEKHCGCDYDHYYYDEHY